MTLSKDQKATAEDRIAAEGFSDRIEALFCDYRQIRVPNELYDNIVSIEMVEHVGPRYLETYSGTIDRLRKPDHGIAVFQSTTLLELVSSCGIIGGVIG